LRTMRPFWRLSACRPSPLPPTTTSEPPPWKASSNSPPSRNTDWPAARLASGSEPRGARSMNARSASSASRSGERPASGARRASWALLARASWAGRMLELEHQVVLQHLRPVLARALLDLEHGRLDLARLEVRDVDLGVDLQLGEFLGERRRAQVARHLGELALLVRERGLDDQELEVADRVDHAPERVVGA